MGVQKGVCDVKREKVLSGRLSMFLPLCCLHASSDGKMANDKNVNPNGEQIVVRAVKVVYSEMDFYL